MLGELLSSIMLDVVEHVEYFIMSSQKLPLKEKSILLESVLETAHFVGSGFINLNVFQLSELLLETLNHRRLQELIAEEDIEELEDEKGENTEGNYPNLEYYKGLTDKGNNFLKWLVECSEQYKYVTGNHLDYVTSLTNEELSSTR